MEQNIKHITKIQSCARGYIVRKVLKQPGDDFSYDMVLKTIDKYIYDINFNKDLNSQLKENNILVFSYTNKFDIILIILYSILKFQMIY